MESAEDASIGFRQQEMQISRIGPRTSRRVWTTADASDQQMCLYSCHRCFSLLPLEGDRYLRSVCSAVKGKTQARSSQGRYFLPSSL